MPGNDGTESLTQRYGPHDRFDPPRLRSRPRLLGRSRSGLPASSDLVPFHNVNNLLLYGTGCEVSPMLSIAELLDKAVEYDRLAKDAAKPERKIKYANIAEYFRYLARELQSIPDPQPSSTARRAKENPAEAG